MQVADAAAQQKPPHPEASAVGRLLRSVPEINPIIHIRTAPGPAPLGRRLEDSVAHGVIC